MVFWLPYQAKMSGDNFRQLLLLNVGFLIESTLINKLFLAILQAPDN